MIAIYNITPYYTKITNHKHAKNHLQNAQKQGNNLFFRRISHLLVYQLQLPAHVPLPLLLYLLVLVLGLPGPGSGPFISMLPEIDLHHHLHQYLVLALVLLSRCFLRIDLHHHLHLLPLSPISGSLFFDDLDPPRGKTIKAFKI